MQDQLSRCNDIISVRMPLRIFFHLLCLLVGCFNFTAGKVLYITPSPRLPCPQQPCFTITQTFSNIRNIISPNITLNFLPGSHSLQSEQVIGNISELHLLTLSDFPLEGASILCGPTAKLLIENVHLVHLSHLYFIGCGGNKIKSVHQLIINTLTFRGLRDTNDTALELVHTNAKIINTTFLFNYGSYRGPIGLLQLLKLQEQIFQQSSAHAQVGGALIMNSSNVSIINSNFKGNIARIGGAIFGEDSSIIVANSTFVNNHAFMIGSSDLCFGGAIFTENGPYNSTAAFTSRASTVLIKTKFINNTSLFEGGAVVTFFNQVEIFKCKFVANSAMQGGALMVTKCKVAIHESYFNLNFAYAPSNGAEIIPSNFNDESVIGISKDHFYVDIADLGNGGVLLACKLTNLTITESVFHNNSAQLNGGVVAMDQTCGLIILQCQFSNNKASRGGVVFGDFQSNVTILHSDFNNNMAYKYGGVISIQNRTMLTIVNTSFVDNIAEVGGVIVQKLNTMALVNSSTFHNNFATHLGGVFALNESHIQLQNSKFTNNRALIVGGVGAAQVQSSVSIINSSAFNSTSELGGVVYTLYYCAVYVERSQFYDCKARMAGGTFAVVLFSELTVKDCELANNTAHFDGGAVYVSNNSYAFTDRSQFSLNKAKTARGGAIFLIGLTYATISNCDFHENSATQNGGAIYLNLGSKLLLMQTTSYNNNADMGGAIYTEANAKARIEESTFIGNTASSFGGTLFLFESDYIVITNTQIFESLADTGIVYILESTVQTENVTIKNNFGSVYVINSEFHLLGNTSFENNFPKDANEVETDILKLNEGGAINSFRGDIIIIGTSNFHNNTAENGAAIHAISSNILVNKTVTITNNTARYNGGGLYLYQSRMQCKFNCSLILNSNHAIHSGGGIYAVSSTIDVANYNIDRGLDDQLPSLLLYENKAQAGGGLYLEANAKLNVVKFGNNINYSYISCCSVMFTNNSADYGGAILVDDGTNIGVCDSNPHQAALTKRHANYTECFLQVLDIDQISSYFTSPSIGFVDNFAHYAGSTLFGGLLDRCIASPFAEVYLSIVLNIPKDKILDGVSYSKMISNLLEDKVSSHPIQVCFCYNDQPDCGYKLPLKEVKKGENFTVALVAVDQVNHTISNTTIHAYLTFAESGFGEGQLIQKTGESCTDLTYSITSIRDYERIIVYAEGPCRDSSKSRKLIDIRFIPCSCPVGFQQKDKQYSNCVCICDTALLQYVSDCDAQEEMVTKSNDAWISYVNLTLNSSGYLIHEYCPFDYCLSPNSDHEIKVNLNEKNGADAQCAHNRTGTLCGTCKHGFSLSLGSSHCIPCSHWHTNLPVIFLSAFISGIVLVALLLVLNLTVAIGTLNGLIFYANIVASNISTFFPFTSPNFVTVFISWLNLDIGIDACFFKGMDAYWKLWIDILFPAYLIFLVVIIIFVSERSTRFAQLIGRKNPVATLATLILLSYTKLLRTIILSFSFATLKYPDDSVQLVWLPDGTIKYLSGKHIALFIMAVFIVVAGVAYTLLLFLWQWILLYQYKSVLKWANSQRLNHFLDPYHAPYVYEYRYWTGLLLLIRAALYMVAAINVSNDPGINLLAIGFVVFGILLLKGCLKNNKIYKKWPLEVIEMISYINLAFICLMSFYLLEDRIKQRVVAFISGSITLTLFIIIVPYHIVFEFILKSKSLKQSRNQPPNLGAGTQQIDNSDIENDQTALIAPTCTIVEAPPPGELPLSALVEAAAKTEQNHSNETEL